MTNQEAIRILDGLKPNTAIAYGNETAYSIGQALTMAIKALEQEPKTGHWIKSNIPNEKYVCSECGGACWYYDYQASVVKSKFCPNCGARMESEDKE